MRLKLDIWEMAGMSVRMLISLEHLPTEVGKCALLVLGVVGPVVLMLCVITGKEDWWWSLSRGEL